MGESVSLTGTVSNGSGNYSYSWSNGLGNTQNVIATPTITRTYTLTVTDNTTGCVATDQVTVRVNSIPNVNAGADEVICLGESVSLTASGGVSYIWSPGGATTPSILVNPTVATTYTVAVSYTHLTLPTTPYV